MKAPLCIAMVAVLGCGPRSVDDSHGNDVSGTMDVSSAGTSAVTGDPSMCPGGVAQGPITLQSDADVALLAGCRVIEGDLHLDPCSDCSSDRSRCNTCGDAEALTSLHGLEALEHVKGALTLGWAKPIGNWAFRQLDIHDCRGPTRLRTLDGLDRLQAVDGDIGIHCAPALEHASFPALVRAGPTRRADNGTDVATRLDVESRVPVEVNFPLLREAGAVSLVGPWRTRTSTPALESVERLILWHTSVLSLDELDALREAGQILINDNEHIADLGPLPTLDRLDRLDLRGMPQITEVVLLTTTSSVHVHDMPRLERLLISPSPEGGLSVTGNPLLTTLDATGLRDAGAVHIMSNDSLTTLSGLATLERVERELRISDNAALCQSEAEAFASTLDRGELAWFSVRNNAEC